MALLPPDCIWAQEEEPEAEEQSKWSELDEQAKPGVGVLILDGDVDAVIAERLVHVRIVGRDRRVELVLVVPVVTRHLGAVDQNVLDFALIGVAEQLGEADVSFPARDHCP